MPRWEVQLSTRYTVNMSSTLHTCRSLLALLLCIYLFTAQKAEATHVPRGCVCPKSVSRVKALLSSFIVSSKGSNCDKVEIIVVLKRNNQTACLSPDGRQGKKLLHCWERSEKTGIDRVKECLRKLRPKKTGQRRQKVKSKKVTS
ncbi:C-X-C motif chemokine 10 [Chanos chanos]|uniref:C-X-C motif chemokine 10 n=1 Tax=Chanos chanos TaxID=29144 RepID=A0A6J2V3H9_CHACN|nr:C-X-C motif chemokine 10-like [Chanos chanos]